MKAYQYILFLLIFISSSKLLGQDILFTKVQVDYQAVPLIEIIDDLEMNFGIKFNYRIFDMSSPKTIKFQGLLQELLDYLFAQEDISYKAIGNAVVLRKNRIVGQRIKGIVVDHITQIPLIGATVTIHGETDLNGVTCDLDGKFEMPGLYVGRYDLQIQYLGYEPMKVSQVLVNSGKEIDLIIELKESVQSLNVIVVTAKIDLANPLNDMATTSARSFSVEETQRYAAAISDPARMVQSFAGVSSGGDDLSNEILIRGNSARGLLWRIEGVEVPNPNHFAGYVSGGGSLSMLSASTLANSDFYTGAFPAEFGNALSGVFDLQLRNGNSQKFEHSFAIGNIGIEAASEGYLSKNSEASYLINFRYSTLKLVDDFLPSLEGSLPAYHDLSFKLNYPTKKFGIFSLFGLGGRNSQDFNVDRDTTTWQTNQDQIEVLEEQAVGLIGITNRLLLSDHSYLKSTILLSGYRFFDLYEKVFPNPEDVPIKIDGSTFLNWDITATSNYHHKFSPKDNIKAGFSINWKNFDYQFETADLILGFEDIQPDSISLLNFIGGAGNSSFIQTYIQWKHRWNSKLELNVGTHFSLFRLNNTWSMDPRVGIKNHFTDNQTISLSLGLHSKPEHPSTYLVKLPHSGNDVLHNFNLKMLKALHFVVGYDFRFSEHLRFKIEPYYQYLFNIPVSNNISSGFSILNSEDIFDIIFQNEQGSGILLNKGRGQNYGVDMTLEKFFSDGYYFLLTSSVFDSKFSPLNRKWYSSYTASNFLLNVLGGREWILKKRRKNILGLNGKFTYYAGRRDQPIDLEASIQEQKEISVLDSYYNSRVPPYVRFDLGLVYKINGHKTTHSFHLDIQNVFNRFNVYSHFYSTRSETIESLRQNGLIPFFTYRVHFSGGKK